MILPILLALAPGLAIILAIYFMDRYEKEPFTLLLFSFVLGMASVLIPLAKAQFLDDFGWEASSDLVETALLAFVGIGFVEEFAKYLMLVFFIYKRPAFNEPFDGIVYAVMVGMGFATIENVIYVLQAGASEGMEMAFNRMFTAVPAHGAFAVMMGYFLGKAKFANWTKVFYFLLAILIPTLFHGAYDFFLMQEHSDWLTYLSIFFFGLSLLYSKSLMKKHHAASPFKPMGKDTQS